MNLNIIIKDLLKEHPEGGEKFFDALDLLIRGDSDILSMFLDFVMNNLSENITYGVVLSGKFGCVLYNNYGHILSKYFDGGIKFDKTVHSLFRYYNNAHDINL